MNAHSELPGFAKQTGKHTYLLFTLKHQGSPVEDFLLQTATREAQNEEWEVWQNCTGAVEMGLHNGQCHAVMEMEG